MKNMDPAVRFLVSVQLALLLQKNCLGSSIAMTVLIKPPDLIIALTAPVAPWE